MSLVSHHLTLFKATLQEALKFRKKGIWLIAVLLGGLSSIAGKDTDSLHYSALWQIPCCQPRTVCWPSLAYLLERAQSTWEALTQREVSAWQWPSEKKWGDVGPLYQQCHQANTCDVQCMCACPGASSPLFCLLPLQGHATGQTEGMPTLSAHGNVQTCWSCPSGESFQSRGLLH